MDSASRYTLRDSQTSSDQPDAIQHGSRASGIMGEVALDQMIDVEPIRLPSASNRRHPGGKYARFANRSGTHVPCRSCGGML